MKVNISFRTDLSTADLTITAVLLKLACGDFCEMKLTDPVYMRQYGADHNISAKTELSRMHTHLADLVGAKVISVSAYRMVYPYGRKVLMEEETKRIRITRINPIDGANSIVNLIPEEERNADMDDLEKAVSWLKTCIKDVKEANGDVINTLACKEEIDGYLDDLSGLTDQIISRIANERKESS